MKIEVESKTLTDAMSKMGVVLGTKLDNLNIDAGSNGIWLSASGNDCIIRYKLSDSGVKKKGKCTISAHMLGGVFKNRGTLNISVTGSSFDFSATTGKYKGTLVIVPYSEIPEPTKGENKDVKFTKALQSLLEDAVPRLSLNNVFTEDPIYIWVHSDDSRGTTIVCGDDLHLVYFRNKEIKIGSKSFTLPLSVFQTLNSLTGKDGYKLRIEETHVYAYSDSLEVTIPITQNQVEHNMKMFDDLVGKLKPKATNYVNVEKEFLQQVLDNSQSVFDSKTPLTISASGSKLSLSVETTYGKVEETQKVKDIGSWPKKGVRCEAALLSDILTSIRSKSFLLNLDPDKCMYVNIKEGESKYTYICVLS